jgi:hypothetical protein
MGLLENVTKTTDRVEDLFHVIKEKRDQATGENKTLLRKNAKKIDKALSLLEDVEEELERAKLPV